ncbi:methyltransferase domain-containing protein [Catenovulum sediminis]|uniref:Methyltransferase domain-containing protein n=1 Tax=Catenovulum sediminis TaxID=1740262 RepID=A0ABV1RGX7_9ALTE
MNKYTNKALYVGCGNDRREGFLHSDTRDIEGIDFVCPAWEISKFCQNLTEIYSRHMLEHLTSMEADTALNDWYKALAIGGTLRIIVPNMDFHIKQWLEAEWNEETLRDPKSNARYGFAGLWGWQRECNPTQKDYNQDYWDVHKSGYNQKRLSFLLKRAGFVDVHTEVKNDVHLVATARKIMNKGERQVSPTIENIRHDHLNRYYFASEYIKQYKPNHILDLACGIGYGAKLLAEVTNAKVTGIDIDEGAICYAKQHYQTDTTSFLCQDVLSMYQYSEQYDAIVSFETIEHIKSDLLLLQILFQQLRKGGVFICSTPNQSVIPFNKEKYKYHIRHYTVDEIIDLVSRAGFRNIEVYTQKDVKSGTVQLGRDGCFTILVCKK